SADTKGGAEADRGGAVGRSEWGTVSVHANVIPLTKARRFEHYWRKLHYVGWTRPARCACGRGKTHWTVAAQHERDGIRSTMFRCRCGRRVLVLDDVDGEE